MNRAYKFRIYPTIEQEQYFQNCFGATRFIWNKMLADKIAYYQETKQTLNNTPAQYKDEFTWLKGIDSLALSNVQMQLQAAYKNFFRNKQFGFPKFKSKKFTKKSYTTNNIKDSIRLKNSFIKLPKIGFVKIKLSKQIKKNEIIKSVTISQSASGKYFISILVEYKEEIKNIQLDKNKSIGLDYSSSSLYIDSQNNKPDYPKFYRKYQEQLAKEQRKLSNMKYSSNNYMKQKIKVAKISEKIANCRNDWQHNLSKQLCDKYDYICIEDLDMKTMSQTLKLGKSTMDNAWGMFMNKLQYKQDWRGHKLIKIDKYYPSSKTCNHCGHKNVNLKLNDRTWVCPSCGSLIERDYNAAKNILEVGLTYI